MLQLAMVVVIVAGAFAYSAWALMPADWRTALRRRLGLATPQAANGCAGCGGGCAQPAGLANRGAVPATAVITLHRRPAQPAATPRPDGSADATAA